MARVVIDGFDLYNGIVANTGVQTKWGAPVPLVGSTGLNSLVAGRFGGQAFRLSNNGANNLYNYSRVLTTSIPSLTVGFAFRTSSTAFPNSTLPVILQFREGATYHAHLTVLATGALQALRATSSTAGTVLGTSVANVIQSNVWHYIEVEFTCNDTTGVFRVYVDGIQVINLTAQDTRNAGTAGTIDTISICGQGQGGTSNLQDFDDLYIEDTATRLGEMRVETLYPTSDIAQGFARSVGTQNFALVDEAQVNGDTDYVQGSTVGDTDTYGIGDLSTTPTSIPAIQLSAFALKTDAGSRSIALQAKSGATTSDGPNFSLAASYSKFERILGTDPNTAAAWTAAAVNALTGGPKVTV